MTANRKPPMPKKLRDKAATAKARHQKRDIAPDVAVTVSGEGWSYSSPYRPADDHAWLCLFLEAFGTRHPSVAHAFINHLSRLCTPELDQETRAWAPNEHELRTAIAIVQSLDPRNEAEAALAAQAVAVHFSAMKVGRRLAEAPYPDARTIAALAALGKVYAGQLETMQKLKGRKKAAKQRITVRYERHNHNHQHVHFEGGGGPGFGGRAHEPCDDRNSGNNRPPLIGYEGSTALPGAHASGVVVPMPRQQGKETLPKARGSKRLGRSEG